MVRNFWRNSFSTTTSRRNCRRHWWRYFPTAQTITTYKSAAYSKPHKRTARKATNTIAVCAMVDTAIGSGMRRPWESIDGNPAQSRQQWCEWDYETMTYQEVMVTAQKGVVLTIVEIGGSSPTHGVGHYVGRKVRNSERIEKDTSNMTKMTEKRRSFTTAIPRSANWLRTRRVDTWKNLKRTCFNFFITAVVSFGIVWELVRPQRLLVAIGPILTFSRQEERYCRNNAFHMGLEIEFLDSSVLPHLLVVMLCFVSHVSGCIILDLAHLQVHKWVVHSKMDERILEFYAAKNSFCTYTEIREV